MTSRIMLSFIATALCFANVACDKKKDSKKSAASGSPVAAGQVAADNTARNKADRDGTAKTSFDQSESSADITITAEIRRELMRNDDMSTTAKNCKIITDKGTVTLRGPVNSPAEKDRIGTLASNIAGVVQVDNQLEIKTP